MVAVWIEQKAAASGSEPGLRGANTCLATGPEHLAKGMTAD